MTDKDKLNKIIDTLCFGNKASFARAVNTSPQTITNWMKRGISKDGLLAIHSAFPQIEHDWLLTGEGSMLKENTEAAFVGHVRKADETDTVNVRFFEVTPTASFRDFCEGQSEEPQSISIVPPSGEPISESDCVFEIYGDSMAPQINNKARVLCREIPASRWHSIPNGQIIVIAYADKFVIKRIGINALGDKNYITLRSDNPEYPAVETVQRADIRTIFTTRLILSSKIY